MSRHTKRVVILFSLLISVSLLSLNSYGQGGSAEKTPPPPSTKQPTKSSQPVKRGTTSSRGSRSTSSNSNTSSTSSASPALEETLKFIHDNVDAHPAKMYPTVLFSQLSGCKVRTTINYRVDDKPSDKNQIATFSLSDINPQSIKITEFQSIETYHVTMTTTGSKKSILVEDNGSGFGSDPQPAWSINVADKESATSISNALSHAIKLCGGKPDPF
jgi:hypothetical protein